MKKINLKKFFKNKKMAAGCITAAVLLTAGSLSMVWQDSQVPELPNYTDPVIEQTIEDDDTPLASQPKVTTKTTRRSKTTKKNIKLKKGPETKINMSSDILLLTRLMSNILALNKLNEISFTSYPVFFMKIK